MADPVTLDFSKSQPIQGGTTLDFSKAQTIDGQPHESTPEGFWHSVGARLQNPLSAGPMGAGGQVQNASQQPPSDNLWEQQKQAIKSAFSDTLDAVTHPSQLVKMLPGWDAVKDKVSPKELDQIKSGDYSGAAGTGLVDLVNLATGSLNPEATTAAAAKAGPPIVRGAAKTTNAILHNAPDLIPSSVAPPIVKKVLSKVTVPGEDFGLYPEMQSAGGPQRGPAPPSGPVPPVVAPSEAPTPAAKQAFLDNIAKKRAALNLPKPEASVESAAPAAAVNDEADLAKALGVTPAQAVAKYGQSTWGKMVTGNNVSDVIDTAIPREQSPALNGQTQAKVNFYVNKGDVASAKQAIQDAADKLDDQAIQQANRANLQGAEAQANLIKGRQFAAGSSADLTKVAGNVTRGESQAFRQKFLPAPNGTMEANKLLGYDPRATPEQVAAQKAAAGTVDEVAHSPWGNASLPGDSDLTAILQKSVDLAKARKVRPTK